MHPDEALIRQIAANAGDHAVAEFGQLFPKHRQLRLWKRYHDSALASLITYREFQQARRTRAPAMAGVD